MLKIFFFTFFITLNAFGANPDICEILDINNCPGVFKQNRRSSAQSLPSVVTSTQFNPANVSHDRGIGVETIYQPGQSPSLSFVTGTGKTGAALVSSKIENGFFGNRVMELETEYLTRMHNDHQYESDKYTLALGAALFKNRKFSMDLGVLLKYNTHIKRVNPGAGLSMRMGLITLGAAVYQDDVFLKFGDDIDPRTGIPYTTIWGSDTYQEKFTVTNFFAGIKLGDLFLDWGVIKTKYKFYDDEDSIIKLFSASYIYKRFLFNLALRKEDSPMMKFENDTLVNEKMDDEIYGGIQYSFGQKVILGLHYNYYLLDEMAISGTLFY